MALEEAKVSRLPMLEVIAARDWKRFLLLPRGKDCSGADAAIDEACAKMKKTREQIAGVLDLGNTPQANPMNIAFGV